MKRLDRGLLLLSLAFWGAVLLLRPFADIPNNDDWAYAFTVRTLLETGRLRLSDWATPNLVSQALWGALFSRLFGAGYGALRLSTLVLAWAGGAAFYRLLRRSGLAEGRAAAVAALLVFNPLYFVLSPSFMTDVPALALSLIALALSRRGVEGRANDLRWLAAGSAFSALAYGVRQTGLMIPMGLAAWLALRRRLDARSLLALGAVPLAAFAVFQAWFHWIHGPTVSSIYYMQKGTWANLSHPGLFLGRALRRSLGALLYLGLFSLPLTAAAAGRVASAWRELSGGARTAAVSLAAALGLFVLMKGSLPYPDAHLSPAGLGVINTDGALERGLPLLGSPWFWLFASAAAWASFASLAVEGASRSQDLSLFLALPLGLEFAATLVGWSFSDRYVLPLVPAALAWAAGSPGRGRASGLVLGAGLALTAGFAWAGTADDLRVREVSWSLGERAVSEGFAPGRILADVDWCLARKYEPAVEELRRRKPVAEITDYDFAFLCTDHDAAVSFLTDPPVPHRLIGSASFFSPLALRTETLYLYALGSRDGSR